MINIHFDQDTIRQGGSVYHVNMNIVHRVTRHAAPDPAVLVAVIKIEGYDKTHDFDVSMKNNDLLMCVVIKLDANGEVSIEKMSEQSFMSRKHMG